LRYLVCMITLVTLNRLPCLVSFSRLERLAKDKHSSLLWPFVSYEENYVWWILHWGLYSHLSITYKWAKLVWLSHYTMSERLAMDKHSNSMGQLVSYEEKSVVNTETSGVQLNLFRDKSKEKFKSSWQIQFINIHRPTVKPNNKEFVENQFQFAFLEKNTFISWALRH
jgi:hypothetical protein